MSSKHLLLCFDAFGTLFKPRLPVAQQYADVARSLGLGGFSNDDVATSFKKAFKQEAKQNPNYGKANGMNPEKWWSNIIQNTFEPLMKNNDKMPKELIPQLLNRFWCDEGYALFSDVKPLIQRIREAHQADKTQVVVGVITNSDDRVPDILTSLGLRVSPLRYGGRPQDPVGAQYDIDFTVMSYDVGYEKPDKQIFTAAEEVLKAKLESDSDAASSAKDLSTWRKVYVGDEHEKDVVGALNAGWNSVLIDRETTRGRHDCSWLEPKSPGNLYDAFKTDKAVGFSSLAKLAEWLPKPT